ncbi:PIR Superfamily Protein [Plasmodium ovale curtisi]|uniref:PIR Superfamily Protein n=1 Tax=Plasmodium ovale curtisi TaxID=864141 RepID=A0A1A8WGQ4_PLAOA|nr:PIR Superfamily Protein [Plasmodium ovale curtisi]
MVEYEYEHVNEFPIYKTLFENVMHDNAEQYYSICDDTIKSLSHISLEHKKIFLFFLRGLIYVYNKFQNSEYNNNIDVHKICEYLNYVLNDQIKNIWGYSYNASKLFDKVKSSIKKHIPKFSVCEREIKDINVDVLNNLNDLERLYNIFNKQIHSHSTKNSQHCDYAKECINLYNKKIIPCYFHKNTDFCKALIKFKDFYNKYVPPDNECPALKDLVLYTGSVNTDTEISKKKTTEIKKIIEETEATESFINVQIRTEDEKSPEVLNDISTPLEYKNFTDIMNMPYNEEGNSNLVALHASYNGQTTSKINEYLIEYNSM